MNQVLELYGRTADEQPMDWAQWVTQAPCPILNRRCMKTRKSMPDVTLGTCSVVYGQPARPVVICPQRLLERSQIFVDCFHLLTLHEPGNELHIVSEVTIPGGAVDYFLVSVKKNNVKDFVGIELQSLDTTGTVWPARQRFLAEQGVAVEGESVMKPFGANWKMTAKTTLVQLNHKIQTFENVGKHLVLVIQDVLFDYMRGEFQFDHLSNARLGDAMLFHVYDFQRAEGGSMQLELASRYSTDANGVAKSWGLQVDPNLTLERITALLESKISPRTLFSFR
jgi:hypothetical protein